MAKGDKDKPDIQETEEFRAAREARERAEAEAAEAETKRSRATKMDDDEYSWVELKNASGDVFGVPAYVLDAAAFHSELDTTKPVKKSQVKSAIDKYLKKEVETA